MVVEHYPPEEIDFAQRLEVEELYVVPMQFLIIYEGGDGTQCLFSVEDRNYADAFVSRWNEAISEDEHLQGRLNYKQRYAHLWLKESDKLHDKIKELEKEVKMLRHCIDCSFNRKGGDE